MKSLLSAFLLLLIFCLSTHAQGEFSMKKEDRNTLALSKEFAKILESDYAPEEKATKLLELIKKTQKANLPYLELKFRYELINMYWNWISIKNYEIALEQCEQQYSTLQKWASTEILDRNFFYLHLADIYYYFKDYSKAISLYEKILGDESNGYREGALNSMGLCYRYGFDNLAQSDSCFLQMLKYHNSDSIYQENNERWDAIAEGNLGRNMLLRKEYDKAIPLLENSMRIMLQFNDYGFSTLPAINLAIVYLKKGNISKSKQYIDLATHYYQLAPFEGLALIYETKSKYFATVGNSTLATLYIDSLLAENKRAKEQFDAMMLMRVEQRKHLSEQVLKEKQLIGYKRSLGIIVVGLFLLTGLFLRLIFLYRKKKAAYRELVRKSQEWALGETENAESRRQKTERKEEANETEIALMNSIEKLMVEDKLFTDVSLSIDSIAQKLNVKNRYVSLAINRCTTKSFNSYINEFRIKEAIQLLSKKETYNYSLDYISYISGFSERTNFYRVFKKMTGLSPSEFKQNVSND